MSRVRNADEFCLEFRKLCEHYTYLFAPRVAAVRELYTKTPTGHTPPAVDDSLEAHVRSYLVNALLAALNWRLDTTPEESLPNLVPEAPIKSAQRGTMRFLDYLGLERQTNAPLLVVETKRPRSSLPKLATLPDIPTTPSVPSIISQGLTGQPLVGEWTEWLVTLQDYVRSVFEQVRQVPRRVVITNGGWLVLFLDPYDTFLQEGIPNPNHILVFLDRDEIEQRCRELFLYLEHGQVSRAARGLEPGELSFHITRDAVDRLMHGLRLHYIAQQGIYQYSPVIKVAPVIFVRSRYGAWLRIEAPPIEYELPHQGERLSRHLAEVHQAAMALLARVNAQLENCLQPSSLAQHYEEEAAFDALQGVVEHEQDQFFVVTGDKTHYLLPEPSVPQCPHHDWGRSNTVGAATNPGPIMIRSIQPRAFFISQEVHHCAHRDVAVAKASQITPENHMRCGVRSGQDGQAFCEIWRFETHLCCRTCAFEKVCTKAQVFQLPCQPPSPRKKTPTRRKENTQ